MKDYPEPLVTIGREEYDQLTECRSILDVLFRNNCIMSNTGNHANKWNIDDYLLNRTIALYEGYNE